MNSERPGESLPLEKILQGLLVLAAADRDERAAGRGVDKNPIASTELVLARAGWSAKDISIATGKPYEAVRSTLRRGVGKAGRRRSGSADVGGVQDV